MMPPAPEQITGLVLAGGRGSRMGGADKGLLDWHGRPLAQQALDRLRPQVGALMLNANRHLDAYASMGVPVWPDASGDFDGPLAGVLAGLRHATTPWLVTVPCDTPLFPTDLAARLAAALATADAQVAMAASVEGGELRTQPVFCLLQTSLHDSLAAFLAGGQRKIERFTALHRCVAVPFDDAEAFFNLNTEGELQQARIRSSSTP